MILYCLCYHVCGKCREKDGIEGGGNVYGIKLRKEGDRCGCGGVVCICVSLVVLGCIRISVIGMHRRPAKSQRICRWNVEEGDTYRD